MRTEGSRRIPTITHRMALPQRIAPLAWAILSFVGFVASIFAFAWPAGRLEEVMGLPQPVNLGIWAFTWVLACGPLALLAARLAFGRWLDVRPVAWLLLLSGAAVSAATVSILADWTIARFGVNESELVGPMSLLFGVIAGVAIAGFGVLVAPRWAAWSPLSVVGGGALIGASIILSNVPGLADGIGRDSGPLAAVTVAATIYIGAVGVLSLAHLRRG